MDINRDKRLEAYDRIIEYQKQLHEKNQKRIKIGIKAVLIVPLIFLIIMFKLESSKVVFLVLWITSMFIISAYLITVEYADYKIQRQLKEWGLYDITKIEGLINKETVMEKIIMNSIFMDEPDEEDEYDEVDENDESYEYDEVDENGELYEYDEDNDNSYGFDEIMEKKVQAFESKKTFVQSVEKKSPNEYAQMRRAKAKTARNTKKTVDNKAED